MGCFNVVCNLSGLPITSGKKVKLIITIPPLVGSKSTSLCYPGDIRTPCFMPISGIYDDYGAIENVVEDNNTALIDSYFKEAEINKWLRFTNRRRSDHDKLVGIEKWIKHIASESFNISRHHSPLRLTSDGERMSLSFVLQEVWVQYQKAIDPYKTFRKKMAVDADAWFEWFKNLTSKLNARTERYPGEDSSLNQYWGQNATGPRAKGLGVDDLSKMGFIHFVQSTNNDLDRYWLENIYFTNYFQPLFFNGDLGDCNDSKWTWFREACVEFSTICNVMREMPLFWMPTMVGGQDAAFNLARKLAIINQDIIQNSVGQKTHEF